MGAPKNPNNVAATFAASDAARRKRLDGMAEVLRGAGAEVVLPYASQRTDVHVFQVEVEGRTGEPWTIDRNGSKTPAWYTAVGCALRVEELEARGTAARSNRP